MSLSGGGSFTGAAIGGSVAMSGGGGFHYDESLGKLAIGVPTSFQFVSWVEDIR